MRQFLCIAILFSLWASFSNPCFAVSEEKSNLKIIGVPIPGGTGPFNPGAINNGALNAGSNNNGHGNIGNNNNGHENVGSNNTRQWECWQQ